MLIEDKMFKKISFEIIPKKYYTINNLKYVDSIIIF